MSNRQHGVDPSLFQWIDSQTSAEDRIALLTMREAVCGLRPEYHYLEIGSHLGGSLQPHVADPRCATIYSVDPRPQEQPDERLAGTYKYESNSTTRMMELLAKIPGAALHKVVTFESCSWDLRPDAIPTKIDFSFIDGEHTNTAVLKDYAAVRQYMSKDSLLSFHDCFVTPAPLLKIARDLARSRAGKFYYFPESNIVCIAFGTSDLGKKLIDLGWSGNLPPLRRKALQLKLRCRWEEFKTTLKNRYPWLIKTWRKLRRW
jgi:hypothetical protein